MKTKWKKSSTIPRSIPSMNQNLSRKMELDWNTFIKSFGMCRRLKLSETERDWFSVRFLLENLGAFKDGVTFEQGIKEVCKNDPFCRNDLSAVTNAKKHFTGIYNKFSTKKGLIFPSVKDRQPVLLQFLQQEFTTASQQASLQIKNISRSQQMAEALYLLDYGEQEKLVKTWWRSGNRAQAFFVEVDSLDDNRTLQKWLVKRLQRVAEGGEPPKYLAISIPRTWGENAVDQFWRYLRQQLKLADGLSVAEILENLKELCRTKTVVIALYGATMLRSQVNNWLGQVWTELGKIFEGDQTTEIGPRLLMFVTSDRPTQNLPILSQFQLLPCLKEITIEHVNSWRDEDRVIQWENRCRGESQVTTLDKMMKLDEEPWGDPYEVLGRLCKAFGFSGVEDVERHWDLVGEVAS